MTASPSDKVGIDHFDEKFELTKALGNSSVTLFKARAVSPVPSPVTGFTVTKLAETAGEMLGETGLPNSWAESNPKQFSDEGISVKELYDPTTDKPGPISVMCAVEVNLAQVAGAQPKPDSPDAKGKILVIGDSDFLTNGGMTERGGVKRGHLDLALNIFNWMSGQVDLISIRDPEMDNTSLTLTPEQKKSIRNLTVAAIPAIFAILGIGVAIYRRKRYV
jgi:hypothetical protein